MPLTCLCVWGAMLEPWGVLECAVGDRVVLGAVNSAVNNTCDAGSQHTWQVFRSILMLSGTVL